MSDEGLTLLAQGREAEIFLLPDGHVLKLVRHPEWNDRVEREAAVLATLAAAGLAAPKSFGMRVVDGRAGLVMERLAGVDMLQLLGRRPYALDRVARVMAAQHAAMHECVGPASLPALRDQQRGAIEAGASEIGTDHVALALDTLATLRMAIACAMATSIPATSSARGRRSSSSTGATRPAVIRSPTWRGLIC